MRFETRHPSFASSMRTGEPAAVPVRKHAANGGQPETTGYDASRSSPEEREHRGSDNCCERYSPDSGAKALCHAPRGYSRCGDRGWGAMSKNDRNEAGSESGERQSPSLVSKRTRQFA
jgi:hypothetical protein